jgi:hypothetical protein
MVVQPATEPVDLAAAAEYDKERQTIEKSLSKLSPPIVRDYISQTVIKISFDIDSRY